MTRRQFLTMASAGIVAASLPATLWRRGRLSEAGAESRPRFFADPNDYATLADLVDRIIPPDLPPGTLSGAKAAGVADYIDFLLGAFLSSSPFIFGGGPFSDRNPVGGQGLTDDMAQPIPLTALQSLAWRIRILGTKGAASANPGDAAHRHRQEQQQAGGPRRCARRPARIPESVHNGHQGAARFRQSHVLRDRLLQSHAGTAGHGDRGRRSGLHRTG